MLRAARWLLLAGGLVVLGRTGVSIFAWPAHETLYALDPPLTICAATACYAHYRLEIGNTGREVQPEVLVRLRASALEPAVLLPRARTFGAVERAVRVHEGSDLRSFALGPLRPEERVDLRFTLRRADRGPASWDGVFVAVTPARGRARRGSPGWVILVRIYHDLLRWF